MLRRIDVEVTPLGRGACTSPLLPCLAYRMLSATSTDWMAAIKNNSRDCFAKKMNLLILFAAIFVGIISLLYPYPEQIRYMCSLVILIMIKSNDLRNECFFT